MKKATPGSAVILLLGGGIGLVLAVLTWLHPRAEPPRNPQIGATEEQLLAPYQQLLNHANPDIGACSYLAKNLTLTCKIWSTSEVPARQALLADGWSVGQPTIYGETYYKANLLVGISCTQKRCELYLRRLLKRAA